MKINFNFMDNAMSLFRFIGILLFIVAVYFIVIDMFAGWGSYAAIAWVGALLLSLLFLLLAKIYTRKKA